MKSSVIYLHLLGLVACSSPQVHPPVGGILSEKDLSISKNRAKNLNELEREQILYWIDNQKAKFYSTQLGYWTNIEHFSQRERTKDGNRVSFSYQILDFDLTKIYNEDIVKQDVTLGKFDDLKAIEDAIRYLEVNEEVRLLIPSALAYGTYGDGDKITNDIPLIINLKRIN